MEFKQPPSEAADAPEPARSGRGGARPGAGRKRKDHASPSAVSGLDLKAALAAPPPDAIETIAQAHALAALATLVRQVTYGRSEQARINAANTILDRGYGKPSVDLGGEQFLPFLGTAPTNTMPKDVRDTARKFAHLAIEVLSKIATNGESETARIGAAKSLLDRGVGTVAIAKVPEDRFRRQQPLGKKEEASQNAKAIGSTGRYKTPPPPGVTLQ